MVNKYVLAVLCPIVLASLYGAEYGKIGVGVTRDLLPNFVNLIFNDAGVSKASEIELKQAQERLALGLQHARNFISDRYANHSPYQSSINKLNKDIEAATEKIKDADIWSLLDEKGKYEFAKKTVLKRNPHFAHLDQEKWAGNVDIELQKLEFDFSPKVVESNKRHLEYLKKELDGLKHGDKLDSIMKMIELSPDTVGYFYSKRIEFLSRRRELHKTNLSSDTDRYINNIETYGTIREQAAAVALQKNDVNRFSLSIALQKDFAEWSKSQSVLNLFNSVYLDGYFNYGEYNGAKSKSTAYVRADIHRHFGDIIDIFNGAGGSQKGVLMNSLAVLQAQSIKRVIRELFEFEGISGDGRSLEYLANPSEQSIAFARRKKSNYESILKSKISGQMEIAGNEYEKWAAYLELLVLSLQCDNIVREAIVNNIRNRENAEKLYNSKIKDILGNTVRLSGAYYYNF